MYEVYPTGERFNQIMAMEESPQRDREIFRYIAELQREVCCLENQLENLKLEMKDVNKMKNEIMNLSFIKKIKDDSYIKGRKYETDLRKWDNLFQ